MSPDIPVHFLQGYLNVYRDLECFIVAYTNKDVDKGFPLRKVQILGFWFRGLGGILA